MTARPEGLSYCAVIRVRSDVDGRQDESGMIEFYWHRKADQNPGQIPPGIIRYATCAVLRRLTREVLEFVAAMDHW